MMSAFRVSFQRSLSGRLVWLTVAFVLAIAILVFVPALTSFRQAWVERRLSEAQIAALAAAGAPDGLQPALRDALLRLSGTEVIRTSDDAGAPMLLLPDRTVPAVAAAVDLRTETIPQAVLRAFIALAAPVRGGLEVTARAPMHPWTTLTIVLRGDSLSLALRGFAGAYGVLAMAIALTAGGLVYAVLLVFFVRPMSHITGSIRAFRADPERTPPLNSERTAHLADDEIAQAARELGAMQGELRLALWRNARLAAVGAAVAKVSHDLRGILSPALLSAERLQSHEDATIRRTGDILVRSIERATELLQETVAFARDAPAAPTRARCALHPIITEAAEQASAEAPPGVAFEIVSDSEDLEAEGDPTQLLRVFGNLFRNAVQANARSITVTLAVGSGVVFVTVSDDADGLPPEVQDQLFKPFVTGGRDRGTGLGLAIVHDLVRAQRGEIRLVATGPAGTAFELTLPATPGLRRRVSVAA
jgi:signal transduction histidine kinase